MISAPTWLPAMCNVTGQLRLVYKSLYAIFAADFVQQPRTYCGLDVWWDRTVKSGETYEEGFLHLVQRDIDLNNPNLPRVIDPPRAERLPWCGPCLSNCADTAIKTWDYLEGNRRVRTYVWLENWDYVVVLEKRATRNFGTVAMLVTAFHIDGAWKRRQLKQKHDRREP